MTERDKSDKITYDIERRRNIHNLSQRADNFPRCLCVCTGGMLRSPTMAWILSNWPYNYNTRAAGVIKECGPIAVDQTLIQWADIIVCADEFHLSRIRQRTDKPIYCLSIEDVHEYRDYKLIRLITERLKIAGVPTRQDRLDEQFRARATA